MDRRRSRGGRRRRANLAAPPGPASRAAICGRRVARRRQAPRGRKLEISGAGSRAGHEPAEDVGHRRAGFARAAAAGLDLDIGAEPELGQQAPTVSSRVGTRLAGKSRVEPAAGIEARGSSREAAPRAAPRPFVVRSSRSSCSRISSPSPVSRTSNSTQRATERLRPAQSGERVLRRRRRGAAMADHRREPIRPSDRPRASAAPSPAGAGMPGRPPGTGSAQGHASAAALAGSGALAPRSSPVC